MNGKKVKAESRLRMKYRRILPKRLPIPLSTSAAEREYQRSIVLYHTKYISLVTAGLNEILPELMEHSQDTALVRQDSDSPSECPLCNPMVRMDAPKRKNIEKSVRELFEGVQGQLMKSFPDKLLRRWSERMVSHVNDISKKNMIGLAESVDLHIEPLLKDDKLTPFFRNVVNENVGLIRTMPDSTIPAFKKALIRAITEDRTHKDIAEIITKYTANTRGNPRLIARDQVNKLNGRLNQYRQEKLGGERYVWRTSKDERVAGNPAGKYPDAKPSHWDREGKIFYWNDPPEGGHPSQRILCRCSAELILSDIVD